MKEKGYYTTGQFAKKAHCTIRTLRFYDQKNLLKPSVRTEYGTRYYTEEDFARLQQILLLKYLGFSLDDIREMTLASADRHYLLESMEIQKKLIRKRIEEMKAVSDALESTSAMITEGNDVDYDQLLTLINRSVMENSLREQYSDAANISSRIRLHKEYSLNKQGWFPWIFEQCALSSGMHVLETGCGNGALWLENHNRIPEDIHVVLSDISEGMVRDAQDALGENACFSYEVFDCRRIPYPDASFDRVIANHMLFYCDDLDPVLKEIRRVLKPHGVLICSTYGRNHMKEITELVQGYNEEIVLSGEVLYEKFGLENGKKILDEYFSATECRIYEDEIVLDEAEPLISYILSCHGNQNRLLLDRFNEFREYVKETVSSEFHITKEAGIFLSTKEENNT